MELENAVTGSIVADAASMGMHWLYDQSHLKDLQQRGDLLFREPDEAAYAGKKGFFAHAGKHAGELSHYGESTRLVVTLTRSAEYSTDKHRDAFMKMFGPCGSYCGYADRPTKALVARMLNEESVSDPSGMDDDQMPALCVIPGLFAASAKPDQIRQAASVISTHADVKTGTGIVLDCLSLMMQGKSLSDALRTSVASGSYDLASAMRESINTASYQPEAVAEKFGMACYVRHSLPVIWHLLANASGFEQVVRDNVRCGGDCCGRAVVLGALAGLAFGVPESLQQQVAPGVLLA